MSIKKLFEKNRQSTVVNKYLKNTNISAAGAGLESSGHLSESLKKRDAYIPPLDYSNPKNFVKYGSAEKYYKDAIEYIADYYPYDGSGFEKLKFENDLNLFEKYIFRNKYPVSVGHASFGLNYTGATSKASNYFSSSVGEFIRVKGGPNKTNVYDEEKSRTNNLEFGGPSGSTFEFFFNKGTGMPPSGQSKNQVIFDLHNGISSGSNDYGRFRVEIRSGSEDRFYVTMQSGGQAPSGFCRIPVPTTGGLSLTNGKWAHYAFAFDTGLAQPKLTLYRNGKCVETVVSTGSIGLVTGSLVGSFGALQISPSGTSETLTSAAQSGFGRLSASLDEVRFWKKKRTSEEVGRHWFTSVDGGTNKYDANVSLGLYYKFNEGIIGKTSQDRIVTDYSGRMSNGVWYGYNVDYSRNLKSGITEMSKSNIYETADPIIRTENTRYTELKSELELQGQNYDYDNPSSLINSFPTWILEEDEAGTYSSDSKEKELKNLVQIMSVHFDTLHSQISALSEIKNNNYSSGSLSGSLYEFPYNDRLLENVGLEAPELFKNIDTLQQFFARDEQIVFNQDISNVKNSIYKTIYNNLNSIYKSKGTEKSIRNFIRCLGVGENIIDLNTYANNVDYKLLDNYKDVISPKKYVDFSGLLNTSSSAASVFQYYQASNANSFGLISGSTIARPTGSVSLAEFAFTTEADIYFPNKLGSHVLGDELPPIITSSLFGFQTPNDQSPTSTNISWAPAARDFGLNVVAVRNQAPFSPSQVPDHKLKDVYFAVRNRAGNTLLTSSVFGNVYDNERWQFALSVRPSKYPFVSGVLGSGGSGDSSYILSLCGYNYNDGLLRNSFSENVRINDFSGSAYINTPKRLFMGALRENHTGSLIFRSDVRATSLRYWTDFLPTGTVKNHALNADTYGREHPLRNTYSFQNSNPGIYVPQIETLALNWDYADVSGSDADGRFKISDFSSGSNGTRYDEKYQGDVFTNLNLRDHTGRGDLFFASSEPVQKQYVYTKNLLLPEYAASGDMVNILDADIETFTRDSRPINYFFAIEKSLYRSISNRMLNMFATMAEYNNLVGEPVNKYRARYKGLEKMREIFFRNHQGTMIDFDRYVRFYKWLDSSMNEMIEQLFPASAQFSDKIRTVVESHILERPKVKYGYIGNIKDVTPSPSGSVSGKLCSSIPGWRYNHAPLNEQQNTNCSWWRNRLPRTDRLLTSGDSGVDADRQKLLRARQTAIFSGGLACVSADVGSVKVGGINQSSIKLRNSRDYTFYSSSLRKNTCSDDIAPAELQKERVAYTVIKDGLKVQGKILLPFTAISASTDGDVKDYKGLLKRKGLGYVDFANLHEDSIHPYQFSVPMQSPFTQDQVGGFASRHVRIGALKARNTRPESWNLTFSNGTGSLSTHITGSTPKGHYLRGMGSKSPINIANIRTSTGSIQTYEGAARIGNFSENYEVVQTNDRRKVNLDLALNPSNYYNEKLSGTIASAFLTSITRRQSEGLFDAGSLIKGLTGSLGYSSPREQSDSKKTKSVFVQRFAAPGSRYDSNQLFRDLESDQLSPNNALPFRNMVNRQSFYTKLKDFSGWGGFVTGSGIYQLGKYGGDELDNINRGLPYTPSGFSDSISPPPVSIHKVQRNTRERLIIPKSGAIRYDHLPSRPFNSTRPTVKTGTLRDNGFITRPIPDADRPSWFQYLSGSDEAGVTLRTSYILSGSRFASDMNVPERSFAILPASKATSTITIKTDNAAQLNAVVIGLTGSDGAVLNITASQGASVGTSNIVTSTQVIYGVNGASNAAEIATAVATVINNMVTNYGFSISALAAGDSVNLTQNIGGSAGNTAVTERYGTAAAIDTENFTGGAKSITNDFGTGEFYDISGKNKYIWTGPGFAPWSNIFRNDSNIVSQFRRENIIEFSKDFKDILTKNNQGQLLSQVKLNLKNPTSPPGNHRGVLVSDKGYDIETEFAHKNYTDRAGNTLVSYIQQSFKEPMVTSRYLPMVHQVKTNPGTAARTLYGHQANSSIKYSYGNVLMGFANREINKRYTGKRKYAFDTIRRPYEILRDTYSDNVESEVDGVDIIRLTTYSEVIYPKEKYTYLSGSRVRHAFKNSYWKNDFPVDNNAARPAIANITTFTNLRDVSNIKTTSRTFRRAGERYYTFGETNSSITSQGYTIQGLDVFPRVAVDENLSEPGLKSIWPLDSYFYSDTPEFFDNIAPNSSSILGAASTMPCGELMMTNYGSVYLPIFSFGGSNSTSERRQQIRRNESVTAQYVYSVPTVYKEGFDVAGAGKVAAFTFADADPLNYDPRAGFAQTSRLVITQSNGAVYQFIPQGGSGANTASMGSGDGTVTTPYTFFAGINGLSTAGQISNAFAAALTLASDAASMGDAALAMSIGIAVGAPRINITSSVDPTFELVTPSLEGNRGDKNLFGAGGLAEINRPATSAVRGEFEGGTGSAFQKRFLHDAPGGLSSRPAWTAGRKRKFVEGPLKGEVAPVQFPFYDSYEKYVEDIRAAGKEYTIIPEFRVSTNIRDYLGADDVFSYMSGTLSLTGANLSNFDGGNPKFFERYAQTDYMEFLDPFMKKKSVDIEFNKYPKHFEMKSDAMIKLLPYEGFYPVNRTLEMATLFSQSFTSGEANPNFTGASGSSGERFRSLLRPFFAPGILYNSIKSGMAVDYPILRGNGKSAPINVHATIDHTLLDVPTNTLRGIKSGTYSSAIQAGNIPGNRRRAPRGGWNFNDAVTGSDLAKFWWSERLPFEAILDPTPHLAGTVSSDQDPDGVILADINEHLYSEITGSVLGTPDDLLYKKAMSNFLANVPSFFLKKKTSNGGNEGNMTKFVARFGENTPSANPNAARTVTVDPTVTYMMEIGITKTSKFNLYNNPHAFGIPTATGSTAATDWNKYTVAKQVPSGANWPLHRGEFAPFTPPYFYGASIARITYMPPNQSAGRPYQVTLDEIIGDAAENTWVEFVNESGSYYDFDSGSFRSLEIGSYRSTVSTPPYKWNRAWQNRMDIDASIVIDNKYPIDNGFIKPKNPNKWVVMPKWECPILDFPSGSNSSTGDRYNFSSSLITSQYDSPTFGMWHQYGVEPSSSQGIYMFLRNVKIGDSDLRLVGDPAAGTPTGKYELCSKVPRFVFDARGHNSPQISSLAELVGFDPEEVIDQGFDPTKAKRLGELESSDGSDYKTLSEAIVAIPYYTNNEGKPITINLKGNYSQIGPKVKQFRQVFGKYSMPPNLALRLLPYLPKDFPIIPTKIDPFSGDSLDELLPADGVEYSVPVVYLMEHTIPLTKQDLADIWQGIMPEVSKTVQKSMTAIDHYMPAVGVESNTSPVFPEILKIQRELGIEPTGVARVDLLDTTTEKDGFHPEIKWLVFKVKQRGMPTYTDLIRNEIDGYDSLSYLSQTRNTRDINAEAIDENGDIILSEEENRRRVNHTKAAYLAYQSYRGGDGSSVTYNWPYDMCSLIETAKITTKVGFRPDLEKEVQEYNEILEQQQEFAGTDTEAAFDSPVGSLAGLDEAASYSSGGEFRSDTAPGLAGGADTLTNPSLATTTTAVAVNRQVAENIARVASNLYRPR